MKTTILPLPVVSLLAGTRVLLGAGVGLLLADKMKLESRKTVGWTLAAVGGLTTIPLLVKVLKSSHDRATPA
jgi:hypothetical protein